MTVSSLGVKAMFHLYQQLHPLACGRRDYGSGSFHSKDHRLLDQDVLTLLDGEQGIP
jgi:hypothetical protein